MRLPQPFSSYVFLLLLIVFMTNVLPQEGFAIEVDESNDSALVHKPAGNSSRTLTREFLRRAINLERFSLNYALENTKREPAFRRVMYFLAHDAGGVGVLTTDVVADHQFNLGRVNPLRINNRSLHNATRTGMIGLIITGAGDFIELGATAVEALRNKRSGLDPRSADNYLLSQLQEMDRLLSQRDALMASHVQDPEYRLLLRESRTLHGLREAIGTEYAHFRAEAKGYSVANNSFYVMNGIEAAGAATTAELEIKSITHPRWKGPAGICFCLSGVGLVAPPLVATAIGAFTRRHSLNVLSKLMHTGQAAPAELPLDREAPNDQRCVNSEESLFLSPLSANEVARVIDSSQPFSDRLRCATNSLRRFDKVAVQSDWTGPAIGGLFLTEGFLDTFGYYRLRHQPTKAIDHYYSGTVTGTVGASVQIFSDTALLLASWVQERRLQREHRLPKQLIQDRLDQLDQIEKAIVVAK